MVLVVMMIMMMMMLMMRKNARKRQSCKEYGFFVQVQTSVTTCQWGTEWSSCIPTLSRVSFVTKTTLIARALSSPAISTARPPATVPLQVGNEGIQKGNSVG